MISFLEISDITQGCTQLHTVLVIHFSGIVRYDKTYSQHSILAIK